MSTYDDASLIYYPSGYKASKAYSLKPTDGSGDLTFTRASTATRVNAEGLIENAFVLGAELITNGDFSNSGTSWSVSGENATHIATFDGSSLRYQSDTTSPQLLISQGFVLVIGKTYKIVVDIKTLTSGGLKSDTLGGLVITPNEGINTFYAIATGTSFTFTRTTTNVDITINSISIKEVITNNVPRIDYTGGGCGKLLLEPQRTNIFTYSSEFDNAAYIKVGGAVVANNSTSPDGFINADTFTADGANSPHRFFQQFSATSGTIYTASFFVKKGTSNFVQLAISGAVAVGNTNFANFDIENGILGSSGGSQVNNTITDYGNGWYRISSTITAIGTATAQVDIVIIQAANSVRFQSWTSSDSVLTYGAQLEQGSYSTSLINTTTTAVTRVADSAAKSGISSLIGQTEGVVFVEYEQKLVSQSATRRVFALNDGTTSNRITIYINTGNKIEFYVRNSGGDLFLAPAATAGNTTGIHKIAAAYKNGDYAVYMDGVQIISGAGTAGTIPTCSRFDVGSQLGANDLFEPIQSAILFPTRLSNAELATLTTL